LNEDKTKHVYHTVSVNMGNKCVTFSVVKTKHVHHYSEYGIEI